MLQRLGWDPPATVQDMDEAAVRQHLLPKLYFPALLYGLLCVVCQVQEQGPDQVCIHQAGPRLAYAGQTNPFGGVQRPQSLYQRLNQFRRRDFGEGQVMPFQDQELQQLV